MKAPSCRKPGQAMTPEQAWVGNVNEYGWAKAKGWEAYEGEKDRRSSRQQTKHDKMDIHRCLVVKRGKGERK